MIIQLTNTLIINSETIARIERDGNLLLIFTNDGKEFSVTYLDAVQAGVIFDSISAALTSVTVGPPTITNIYQSQGGTGGGLIINLIGSNFKTGCTVTIGGLGASPVVLSQSCIQCITPGHAAGPVDVVYTGPDGQIVTVVNGFEYV